jgi:excisionase family DNA binding protein
MDIKTTPTTSKAAFAIKEAARVSSLSRATLYEAIKCGALRARKCGARTLILDADLREFLRDLPQFPNNQTAPEATQEAA